MLSVAKDLLVLVESNAEKPCIKTKQCPHCIAIKELKRLAGEIRISLRDIARHSGK
jgi:hypothetical protein